MVLAHARFSLSCQRTSSFSVKRGVSKEMTAAGPSEVRRIFTMGLLYGSHNHGGQILFSPTDGYLYLITGHGGQKEDRFDFSQDKRSFSGQNCQA